MVEGARTPEELDGLYEDAFVTRERRDLCALYDDGAVLIADGQEARGSTAIARTVATLWSNDRTYVANTRCVLRSRELALVVAASGLHVLRRRDDGSWRAAISLLDLQSQNQEEDDVTQQTEALKPFATRSGEGEARWWFAALAEFKVTGEQTGGQLSIVEITEPPNVEAPLHVHHREDEGFWILEGDVTFEVGGETIDARAGDFAFGPRGIPHRYTVGDNGCRMLFIMTPGGFENLVREMSVPAQSRTLPPPSDEEPDWEHVAAVAKANGCELVG